MSPPPNSRFPTVVKGPLWGEMSAGALLNTSCSPPTPPSRGLFRDKCSIPSAPFIHLSKSPLDKPSSRFLRRGPNGKRFPSPEPFLHILQGPQQGSPPPGSLHTAPTERGAPLPETLSTISQSPWWMSPLQVAQLSPHDMPVSRNLHSFLKLLFYGRAD